MWDIDVTYIQYCRLCPKKIAGDKSSDEGPKLAPYDSSGAFSRTLDAWSIKYITMHSVRDETPEQTIRRLSEKLCNNKSLLEVGTYC